MLHLYLQGRFSIAAKHHVSIAEIYETELSDIEKAITSYEQAADYYKGEESNRWAITKRKNGGSSSGLQARLPI